MDDDFLKGIALDLYHTMRDMQGDLGTGPPFRALVYLAASLANSISNSPPSVREAIFIEAAEGTRKISRNEDETVAAALMMSVLGGPIGDEPVVTKEDHEFYAEASVN